MKVIDIKALKDDYEHVKNTFTSENIFDEQLDIYFSPETYTVPLANSTAANYLKRLGDEIMAWVLPADGSWLLVEPEDNTSDAIKRAKDMEKTIRKRIQRSNFYKEVAKLVNNILIYNKGFLHAYNSGGLMFRSEPISRLNFFLSEFAEEESQRAYFKTDKTRMAIMEQFKMTPQLKEQVYDGMWATGDNAMETECVIKAIIPNKEPFFSSNNSPYNWQQVYFYEKSGTFFQLFPKVAEPGHLLFPIISCNGGRVDSLAEQALSTAVILERYERLRLDRADQLLNPDIAVGEMTYESGAFDRPMKNSGLIVPVANEERDPHPIVPQNNFNITEDTLAQKEAMLRTIFMIDDIQRMKITNVSQFEYNRNRLNFLSLISPLVTNLISITVEEAVRKSISLLRGSDKAFKGLDKFPTLDVNHLGKLISDSQKAVNLAHFAQVITPFLQMNPESRVAIDSDAVVREACEVYGLSKVLTSDQEIAQIREAQAQQIQQQAAQEQDKLAAETENLQAQAQEKKGGV